MLHDENIQWNHDSMWNIQLDECYLHDIFILHWNKDKQLSTTMRVWGDHNRKPIYS